MREYRAKQKLKDLAKKEDLSSLTQDINENTDKALKTLQKIYDITNGKYLKVANLAQETMDYIKLANKIKQIIDLLS